MYCDRYESDYYISDTKARLPIRWMSWESLLLVITMRPSQNSQTTTKSIPFAGETNNKKWCMGIRGHLVGNSNVVHATALRRTN